MTWSPEFILAGIAALGVGGLLTEAFRWMVTNRSEKITDASKLTDMAQTVVQSYDQLVADLRTQLDEQKLQIEALQTSYTEARIDIGILQTENEDLARQIEALHGDYQSLAEKYQDCQSKLEHCPECQKDQNG